MWKVEAVTASKRQAQKEIKFKHCPVVSMPPVCFGRTKKHSPRQYLATMQHRPTLSPKSVKIRPPSLGEQSLAIWMQAMLCHAIYSPAETVGSRPFFKN